MLQSMLAERFKLAYHREMREYTLDVISVGKGGMKLPGFPTTPALIEKDTLGDGGTHIVQVGTISSFFPVMNSFGGLNLLDETGLPGIYSWVRDQQRAEAGMTYKDVVQDAFRNMITSAGLKLETRKVLQETIVVDHLEKVPPKTKRTGRLAVLGCRELSTTNGPALNGLRGGPTGEIGLTRSWSTIASRRRSNLGINCWERGRLSPSGIPSNGFTGR